MVLAEPGFIEIIPFFWFSQLRSRSFRSESVRFSEPIENELVLILVVLGTFKTNGSGFWIGSQVAPESVQNGSIIVLKKVVLFYSVLY